MRACAALHAGVGCPCMFSVRVLLLDLLPNVIERIYAPEESNTIPQ
jgi:hypothetical protein